MGENGICIRVIALAADRRQVFFCPLTFGDYYFRLFRDFPALMFVLSTTSEQSKIFDILTENNCNELSFK